MKKIFFLAATLAATLTAATAQAQVEELFHHNNARRNGAGSGRVDGGSAGLADVKPGTWNQTAWFDFRLSESFGLNQWNSLTFANDRLPRTSSTDLKVTMNVIMGGRKDGPFGFFIDMGVGFMPGARSNSLGDNFPVPVPGTQYYVRDMFANNSGPDVNASFKMAAGFMGRIRTSSRLYVLPAVGVGFMTMALPQYDVMLKEQGTNMQYRANYRWFGSGGEGGSVAPGYLTGRLTFAWPVSTSARLLLGLEYTWIFTPATFSVTFTNDFNNAITKTFVTPGNKMNMFGVMIGIAL